MKLPDRALLRATLAAIPSNDGAVTPVFVIVMAYAVHIGDLAVRYLQPYPWVCVIANGLSAQEVEEMRARHGCRIVALSQIYEHSEIIDALVAELTTPFWLVDHDCYVLDTAVLGAGNGRLDECAGEAFYRSANGANKIKAPMTFLMRLNPALIRALGRTYGVSARKYWWSTLPDPARKRLEAAGFDEDRRPEASKFYFDTLRVIALLAQADGCAFDISRGYTAEQIRYPDVVHIGATSWPIWPPSSRYNGIGAYFWQRCLAACALPRARGEYAAHWPDVPHADAIREKLLASGMLRPGDAPDLLDFLDALVRGPEHVRAAEVAGLVTASQSSVRPSSALLGQSRGTHARLSDVAHVVPTPRTAPLLPRL